MSMLLLTVLLAAPFNELYVSMLDHNGDVRGSGVRISNDTVITAAHVIGNEGPYTVHCPNGQSDTVLVRLDKKLDLALLRISPACTAPIVDVRFTRLSAGDSLFSVGCPAGVCGVVTSGVVSSYSYINGTMYLVTETEIQGGSSGGGVYDSTQKLVGIAKAYACWETSHSKKNFCLSLFIPVDTIMQFLAAEPQKT